MRALKALAFIRPKPKGLVKANLMLFAGVGFGVAAWWLWRGLEDDWLAWLVFAVLVLLSLRLAAGGALTLHQDWRLRMAWWVAQLPASDKHDGRWASQREMATAGMYDGKGRILGMDMNGRLLFEPHRLKPVFSFFLGGQGSGKTSTQVIASAILSPLIVKRSKGSGP